MKKIVYLFAIVLFSYSCGDKSKSEVVYIDNQIRQIDSLMLQLFNNQKFNGNILLADSGSILFEKSYGIANETSGDSIDLSTTFNLASVSKQFTACGILLLAQEGKLNLEDELKTHLPIIDFYDKVTIRNLLTHTSGIPDYMTVMEEYWDTSEIANNSDVINIFSEFKPRLRFPVNEKMAYSNTNYLLLASIIESVSGKTFANFMEKEVFQPLNMKDTYVYTGRFSPEKKANRAVGYYYSTSENRNITSDEITPVAEEVYLDGVVGDGAIYSSIHDLLLWDEALYDNRLILKEYFKEAISPHLLADGSESLYGFGWYLRTNKSYGRIIKHSGSWDGYLSYFERHIDKRKTIIALQNIASGDSKVPVNSIRKLLYNTPLYKIINLSEDTLAKYAGVYLTENGSERIIELVERKLYVKINDYFRYELKALEQNKFVIEEYTPEVYYEFTLKSDSLMQYTLTQPETGLIKSGHKKATH